MKKRYLNSKAINKLQLKLIELAHGKIEETLPGSVIGKLKMVSLRKR